MRSNEIEWWIIGGFVFLLLGVGPMVGVTALLLSLRNASTRTISVINLVFALGAFLLTGVVLSCVRWADSPSPSVLMAAFVVLCWLAGAIGLFYRKRLAWCGSILGTGALVCTLVVILATVIPAIRYPRADTLYSGRFRVGFIFTCLSTLTWIGLALVIAFRLLIGLLRMRKDIFSGGPTMPNAIEPTASAHIRHP
jgi:hypothetical protein